MPGSVDTHTCLTITHTHKEKIETGGSLHPFLEEQYISEGMTTNIDLY